MDQKNGFLYTTVTYENLGQNLTNVRIELPSGKLEELPDFIAASTAYNLQNWHSHITGFDEEDEKVVVVAPLETNSDDDDEQTAWVVSAWDPSDGSVAMSNLSWMTRKTLDSGVYNSRSNSFLMSMSVDGHEAALAQVCARTGKLSAVIPIPSRHVQIVTL
jgi:hypothetical protein